MHYYAIYCQDHLENNLEKRRSVRPAHLKRLEELSQSGRLLTAGPLFQQDGNNPLTDGIHGSLIIAKFDNRISAQAWAAADPYVTAGIYSTVNIHRYEPVTL